MFEVNVFFCQVNRANEFWPEENIFPSELQKKIQRISGLFGKEAILEIKRKDLKFKVKLNFKPHHESYFSQPTPEESIPPPPAILIAIGQSLARGDKYKVVNGLIGTQGQFNGQKKYRPITSLRQKGLKIYWPQPMIYVGYEPLEENPDNFLVNDPTLIFLDSSIWHHYIPLKNILSKEQLTHTLRTHIESVCIYHQKKIYQSIVAREFLEHQCRKVRNAFFLNIGEGHSGSVLPQRFHLESSMKEKADEIEHFFLENKLSWGCLIIDDYSEKELRISEYKDDNQEIIKLDTEWTKNDLIGFLINTHKHPFLKILNATEKKEDDSDEDDKRPDGEEVYERGRSDLLAYPEADVILLDYYLGTGEKSLSKEFFGSYLINEIQDKFKEILEWELNEEKKKEDKPSEEYIDFFSKFQQKLLNKLWVFPISVFDEAFRSHLRAMGQVQMDELFVIAEGADPVNTPQLFRYLLLAFLDSQRKAAGMSLPRNFRQFISHEKEALAEGFKKTADRYYHVITDYYAKINRQYIAADWENPTSKPIHKENTSLLAFSYLSKADKKHQLKYFVLHLQHLINQIAYGSGLQIAQMWEEYKLVEELLYEIEFLDHKDELHSKKHLEILLGVIKIYLKNLQSTFA
jgi:hypothetical protein